MLGGKIHIVFCPYFFVTLWNMAFHESRYRSVVKALTFRALVVASDVVIVYGITRSYQMALGVIIFSNLSATGIYVVHERSWNRVHWGKKKK